MASRNAKPYRWQKGDLIGATEAAELLGYKSSMVLRDKDRRTKLIIEFELHDCTLTMMSIGGQYRFLRSEIDAFLTAKKDAAQAKFKSRNRDLRIAA